MYTKLAKTIISSTIWGEDSDIRCVWVTMLALADKNGEVHATIPGLARLAVVPVEKADEAIQKFLSPDPYSSTKIDEGRRIEVIPGGWFLINHDLHRRLASKEDEKEKAASRKRRQREREKRNNVTPVSRSVTQQSDSVTEKADIEEEDTDTDTKAVSLSLTREEQERENRLDQELTENAVANGSSFAEAPTIEEVMQEAEMRGIPREHATSFFEYNEGQQLWMNRNGKPINWRMSLKSWSERRRTMKPGQANGKTGYKKIEI